MLKLLRQPLFLSRAPRISEIPAFGWRSRWFLWYSPSFPDRASLVLPRHDRRPWLLLAIL